MKNKEIEELLKGMKDVSNTEGCSMNLDRYLVKLLLSYIEQLEKRNKQLYEDFMATQEELTYYATKNEQLEKKIDHYENPEDLTLFYMWLDTKAKDKMKQMETEILKLKQQNQIIAELGEQLKNNRDKAIEYVEHHKFNKFGDIDCNEAENIIEILKGDSD